ncbi:MAG: fumarylacetoacetate hydrolase family protein [Caulobacterales bacterium]|nr:fumarylacetoacetate hydrolase family protein [Caulobacterales bacterium]
MTHAVTTPTAPALPVVGTDDVFPVGRIFCVGRNYAAHAREMGKDPDRDPPFFFTKFADAYAPAGAKIPYPPRTANYHHEIELVVAIGKGGARISEADAFSHVYGYAVGLDMTRRDLQLEAREKGRPWDMGKNFPLSAPIAALTPAERTGPLREGAITLDVNGARRQEADLRDLIWSVDEIIAELSIYGPIGPGDLIMTGTPAGVGAVNSGDVLAGRIEGLTDLRVTIGESA